MNEITYKGTTYRIADMGLVSPLLEKRFEREYGKPFDGKPPEEGQVRLCMEWLKRFARPRKTVNYRIGSYGLKHCVEGWDGDYVSNGAFIEAAYRLGFEIIQGGPLSPNAGFRLSFDKEALKMERP